MDTHEAVNGSRGNHAYLHPADSFRFRPLWGDIGMRGLVEGSTLYLPVFVPGGMLVMGDCHAVVGDGAVAGTGAECSAETLFKNMRQVISLTTY